MTTETVLTDDRIAFICRNLRPTHYTMIDFARAIERAVLRSPEVRQARKDAKRYRFCRSQSSPAEIHIHGVELGLAGTALDDAMDEEMKEWKS